jgi:hypothetical protein
MAKAKIKAAKGRPKVAYDESSEAQMQTAEQATQDEVQDEPVAPDPPADPDPAPTPKSLNTDQEFLLELAATIYSKAGPGTLMDAYQHAKNLVQMALDDETVSP